MTQYLMRCDGCGAEVVMTRAVGCYPACHRLMEVYACPCGCKLRFCLGCMNRLSFGGDGSIVVNPGDIAHGDGKPHDWRVVAEIEGYPK